MRRGWTAVLMLAVACSSGPSPAPVDRSLAFRIIHEGRNPTPCVDGPDFIAARDEDAWIDAFDIDAECTDGEVRLPRVDFRSRLAFAAWWGIRRCPDATVRTERVVLRGAAIVVEATSSEPAGCEPGARGGLESFVAVVRPPEWDGSMRFVLDGVQVGTADA